jgi:hypothetical protein
MRVQPFADPGHPLVARLAIVGRGTHLDELVGIERAADLGDDLVGESLVADQHDGTQGVCLGAQLAAAPRGQGRGHGRHYPSCGRIAC